MRIAQISLSLKGGFGPTSLPLFQGLVRSIGWSECLVYIVWFLMVVEEPSVCALAPKDCSRPFCSVSGRSTRQPLRSES